MKKTLILLLFSFVIVNFSSSTCPTYCETHYSKFPGIFLYIDSNNNKICRCSWAFWGNCEGMCCNLYDTGELCENTEEGTICTYTAVSEEWYYTSCHSVCGAGSCGSWLEFNWPPYQCEFEGETGTLFSITCNG